MSNILKWCWYQTRHDGVMMSNILRCWYQTRHDGVDACWYQARHDGVDALLACHLKEGEETMSLVAGGDASHQSTYGGIRPVVSLREKTSSKDSHFPRNELRFCEGE